MSFLFAAAFALTVDPTPNASGAPLQSNLEYAQPVAGNWAYESTNDGSEATFSSSTGQSQLTIRCTRSTRRVAILKAAPSGSPSLWIWTSFQQMSLPATYDPSASRVSADLWAYDPFLDAIASSRGRIGVSSSGLEALVVPPWADIARVIEDCRV